MSLSVEEYDVQLDKATEVYISVNKEDQNIDVMIENNGIGIETNTMWSKESIGLQNICSQVQYLHGTVEWNEVNDDKSGTVVVIYIPLFYEPLG